MVRIKNRYFVVEINVEGRPIEAPLSLRPFAFYNSIMNKVEQLYGDYGVAMIKSGFTTKYCNEITRIALLKTRHGPHTILASTLPFVTLIDDKAVALNTIYTGATMKQCFKFIQRHQTDRLNRMWATLKTDAQRKAYRDAVMDFDTSDQNKITMS